MDGSAAARCPGQVSHRRSWGVDDAELNRGTQVDEREVEGCLGAVGKGPKGASKGGDPNRTGRKLA